MNHPLHDHPHPPIDFSFLDPPPGRLPLQPTPATPSLIKPFSAPNLKSPPPPPTPLSDLPQPVHPPFNFPTNPRQSPPHSTLKRLSKAIKKSRSLFNRFVKGNQGTPTAGLSSSSRPTSGTLDPPHPLRSASPSSSSSPASWSACQSHQHPFQSHSPCLDGFFISPPSPADFVSPNPCHSATSSGEFSFTHVSKPDRHSFASSHPKNHLDWIRKFSPSQTMIRLPWSDQNSAHPNLRSTADRSSSPARCSSPGSSGTRGYCISPSPNQLQPVFGITISEALQLASQECHTSHGRVVIPTIVYRCGERLKRSKGTKSHGIFRINGNIKRMRKLESVFMNPSLGYGTYFDILDPRPPAESQTMEDVAQSEHGPNIQSEPYFTIHDVAGVLRRYLWALPEPLVPYPVTTELIQVWRKFQGSQQQNETDSSSRDYLIKELEQVLKDKMKREELDLLNYLLEILRLFSTRSEDNLMNSKNLAIVFQPGIMPIPLSKEDQAPIQNQPHHHLHRFTQSRSSDQLNINYQQQNITMDFQPRSALQVGNGIGLDDYLGQINEVQEILSLLIDCSSSSSSSLNPDSNLNHRRHHRLDQQLSPPTSHRLLDNYLSSHSSPVIHFNDPVKVSGDDGG